MVCEGEEGVVAGAALPDEAGVGGGGARCGCDGDSDEADEGVRGGGCRGCKGAERAEGGGGALVPTRNEGGGPEEEY